MVYNKIVIKIIARTVVRPIMTVRAGKEWRLDHVQT